VYEAQAGDDPAGGQGLSDVHPATPDDSPRRLVILAGWGMPDAELLRALQPLLEPKEIAVVIQALGLDDEQAWNR